MGLGADTPPFDTKATRIIFMMGIFILPTKATWTSTFSKSIRKIRPTALRPMLARDIPRITNMVPDAGTKRSPTETTRIISWMDIFTTLMTITATATEA